MGIIVLLSLVGELLQGYMKGLVVWRSLVCHLYQLVWPGAGEVYMFLYIYCLEPHMLGYMGAVVSRLVVNACDIFITSFAKKGYLL